ncbi:MAG TPA: hypothetical protein DEH78_00965 [Solibacterales bacterium]|nr:hypothetical protein [Bryobacterales bacterium]
MTPIETPTIAQIEELLAQNGYEVAELDGNVLRVKDVETSITFQAVLQGNVLYMTVNLTTVPAEAITADLMRLMLAHDNGISTSAFQLYDAGSGRTAVTLNNFCTLQNMGAEDQDDILSLAGYLMADLMEARDLLEAKLKG